MNGSMSRLASPSDVTISSSSSVRARPSGSRAERSERLTVGVEQRRHGHHVDVAVVQSPVRRVEVQRVEAGGIELARIVRQGVEEITTRVVGDVGEAADLGAVEPRPRRDDLLTEEPEALDFGLTLRGRRRSPGYGGRGHERNDHEPQASPSRDVAVSANSGITRCQVGATLQRPGPTGWRAGSSNSDAAARSL